MAAGSVLLDRQESSDGIRDEYEQIEHVDDIQKIEQKLNMILATEKSREQLETEIQRRYQLEYKCKSTELGSSLGTRLETWIVLRNIVGIFGGSFAALPLLTSLAKDGMSFNAKHKNWYQY